MDTFLFLLKENYEALIALCALFLTLHEAKATRTHNLLSVKPILKQKLHQNLVDERKTIFNYIITNDGLGPAELTEIVILFEGKVLLFNENENFAVFLNNKVIEIEEKYQEPLGCDIGVTILGESLIIKAHEKIDVFHIECWENTKNTLDALHDFVKSLNLKGKYKSLYNENYIMPPR